MKRLMFRWPLMAEAGEGGGGGTGNGEPGSSSAKATEDEAGNGKPASAAAAISEETDRGSGAPASQPKDGDGSQPASAAAAIAAPAGDAAQPTGEKPGNGEPKDVDLAKTTDEDYAKLVMPDEEGKEVDRSLITPMAKELREAGIQPSVMAKIAPIYRKVVEAEVKRAEEERANRMKEMTAKCLKEITEDERRDFAAVYRDHISKDPELKKLVDHTELGSSAAFIRIMALAGATLRVEKAPPASAAAGSGQHDTDRAVFEATVPAHLR